MSRFWWKWFCLFLIMLVKDFRGCLLELVIVWLWWLLFSRVLIVFCSICFLLCMMMFGVVRFSRCFRWLLWLMMWWYRLFRLEVVKWLLFSGISGCRFGGSIGRMVRIIYFGLLLDWMNVFNSLICLVSFLCLVLELVLFSFLCNCLYFCFRFMFFSRVWIVFVFIFVLNLLLNFFSVFRYCFLVRICWCFRLVILFLIII